MNTASLHQELHALKEQVAALQQVLQQTQQTLAQTQQALEQTRQANEALRQENTVLRQKLDALARRFFGKKSEQLSAAQLELLLQGLTEESAESDAAPDEPPAICPPRTPRPNPRRIRTPENLEVVREVIEPELVQAEPEQWKQIGAEVSRQLDYQPGKFFWQETVRPKYVRRTQRELPPVVAPAPLRVADHGLAAPGLLAQAPQVAGWIVKQIGLLYRWEDELRKSRAGPGLREAVRASHHQMVVARLHRALIRLQPRYLPQSPLGQAISYGLNQWPLLERILEHGEVELDNNLVENAIRPTALGKKNWLFFGSAEAGQRSAVMYTLIANCRLHGVEPYAYLKDVLTRLPRTTNKEVAQLTPRRWKTTQRPPVQLAA